VDIGGILSERRANAARAVAGSRGCAVSRLWVAWSLVRGLRNWITARPRNRETPRPQGITRETVSFHHPFRRSI